MKRSLLLIVLIVLSMSLSMGCSSQQAMETADVTWEQPTTVEVAKVEAGQIENFVSYSSRVKPAQEIMVLPKVPGKVLKINFDLGDRVKKGQILFELDKTDALLQLNQAAAAVDMAEINLKKMSGTTYEQQMLQLKSAVASAEINYNDAKTNLETIKTLYEVGAESKFNYDRAKSQLELAKQQYETAKANLELTEQKSFAENIETAQAQLNQAKASYDIAKNAVDNMSVKSPISGVVSAKNVKVGEFVSNTTPSFIIIDDSSYIIEVDVNEDVIGKVKIGDKVKVSIGSIAEEALSGTVVAAAPSADAMKQTYLVKITLDNPPSTIKGGMFAQVQLILDRAENCILVPLSSVVEEEGRKYVFVINGDKAIKTEVDTGIFNDNEIQIIHGLNEGETVVVKGQNFLKDGSTVVISDN
ncbi:efflux RND transporter periplasmic adaptor subunit [Lutispora sp.]|uniref:efflux RND transporter periplasmic adaptor subunit n=1 Tax=Lutispora sp. TaxID=2828727 RepID=UPI00356178E1